MKEKKYVLLIVLVFAAGFISALIVKNNMSEVSHDPEQTQITETLLDESSTVAIETETSKEAIETSADAYPEPSSENVLEEKDIKVMIATDFHFLSSELTDDGSAAMEVAGKEGQLSQYSDEIVAEFIRIAMEISPDLIVIPGDLAFRGEQKSLEELASKWRILSQAGIQIITIPGNHDIESETAFLYKDEEMIQVDNVSSDEFIGIMGEFGYQQAVSIAPDSLSYVYKFNDQLAFMCLDANTPEYPFEVSRETLAWADRELEKLKEEGLQIIGVTHQNLLTQNTFRYEKIAVSNASEVLALYRKYDVRTNLCGHFHVTHQAKEDDITEYCTGAICIYPLSYAVLNISENKESEYQGEHLEILQDESLEVLRKGFTKRILNKLEDVKGLSNSEKEDMIEYALKVIENFYAGTLDRSAALSSDTWLMWKEYCGDNWWFQYLESILNEY